MIGYRFKPVLTVFDFSKILTALPRASLHNLPLVSTINENSTTLKGTFRAASLRIVSFVSIQIILFLHPQLSWCKDGNQFEFTTEAASHERIISIDRTLLLELIKLARFNIQFHQEANRHQKWRALTYATGRETGTAVSFASSLVDLQQRVRGLEDPALISRNALRNVVTTSLVGNAISGSASGLELAQNTWVMLEAHKQGYSPKASVDFVKNIVGTTDTLFDERERAVAAYPLQLQRERRVYELDGILIRRIRQQLLSEFRTWSCHSRGRAWRENTFYSLDALQNFTRMSAAIIGLKGFSQPNVGGTAAVSTMVANSVATLNPIVCGLVGLAMRKYQLKKLSRELPIERPVVLDQSLAELKLKGKDMLNESETKLMEEALSLSDKSERFDVVLDRENREIERLRRVAQQQTIAGPLIGLTSMPASILGTIAFYDYRHDRETTNKLLFAGRISAIAGQSYALIQTPYTMISGMRKNRQLKRRGELPSQLLEERLKNLDRLEAQIISKRL